MTNLRMTDSVSQDFISEVERDILLRAYTSRSRGVDAMNLILLKSKNLEEWRSALAQLVLRDYMEFAGENTFTLTEEGELTAAMLMTDVTA